MNVESVYDDGKGTCWHIGDLLASDHRRSLRRVDVRALLAPYLGLTLWERDGGTPATIGHYARRGGLGSTRPIAIPIAQRERVAFVLGGAERLRQGIEPAPLVVGLDGRLWDGLHRLIAYDLAGRKWCYVIDFAHCEDEDSLAWSPDGLRGLLHSQWLDMSTLASRQGEFWGALGFPHLVFDNFFSRRVAKQCYLEMVRVRGWNRVVTDFYSQEEILLERDDQEIGQALRRIVGAFTSLSMRRWIARCTGRAVDVVKRPPTVVLHRMRDGDYIGVHNDHRRNGEAVRLVVFVGGERKGDGGVLVAMDGNSNDPLEAVSPIHNRLFLFGISDQSNHLVTEVSGGDRYSIVFSYFLDQLT